MTESCDDGNLVAGDGCGATCAIEVGFRCATAGAPCASVCGDGFVRGREGCDQGPPRSGNGCGPTCQPQAGFVCQGEGYGSCRAVCGDGRVLGEETCDDGNQTGEDGCSSECRVEGGYTCDASTPSTCLAICGDGRVLGGESCDDGNRRAGDGCSPGCVTRLGWRDLPSDLVPAGRYGQAAVWTGAELFMWGGWSRLGAASDAALYNPAARAWRRCTLGPLGARVWATAAWTGRELLVWGGSDLNMGLGDGARYDLAQDVWTTMSSEGAPSPRFEATGVWTGREFIVFGGIDDAWDDNGLPKAAPGGAAYDPTTDSWRSLSSVGAPSHRLRHLAVWTGEEMIVFGGRQGFGGGLLADGARYDPRSDTWRTLPSADAPPPADAFVAVWTGSEVLVFGAEKDPPFRVNGAAYDPARDVWRPLAATTGTGGEHPAAFWTGSELIVWGGWSGPGAKYFPAVDAWAQLPSDGAPLPRSGALAHLTDQELIVFGGVNGGELVEGGGVLDLATGRWSSIPGRAELPPRYFHTAVTHGAQLYLFGGLVNLDTLTDGPGTTIDLRTGEVSPLSASGAPPPRVYHAAVATEREMIVFGGADGETDYHEVMSAGASYDFELERWSMLPSSGSPSARRYATATWTGTEVIVWGGDSSGVQSTYFGDGAAFDVTARRWRPLPPQDGLSPRSRHTAIWTGTELIIWGGWDGAGDLQSGARYQPELDRWTPLSLDGAPSPRWDHTAVWSGTELLIWGGSSRSSAFLGDGARYDPVRDRWLPMSSDGAPAGRVLHTATWTGAQMVVFGGYALRALSDGARYDPGLDAWLPLPRERSPSERLGHTAVWSVSELVIWGGSPDLSYAIGSGAVLDL